MLNQSMHNWLIFSNKSQFSLLGHAAWGLLNGVQAPDNAIWSGDWGGVGVGVGVGVVGVSWPTAPALRTRTALDVDKRIVETIYDSLYIFPITIPSLAHASPTPSTGGEENITVVYDEHKRPAYYSSIRWW